ncbi:SAM-dependent methyltransferase [Streptomyces sp. 110]|uniref:SAM-dependent methyltransferase n=1 Tax=Streptomyces endocoffeicus TaxID=2898945 RepID=A0ABS1PSC1_9ACTN|nr:SAM-dependent methyltransferase [Streptomyces endocoffeicus]MBL1115317.1 SAM-dependent methyltransferase [Streptomyces endocoffeicus]
MTSDGANRPAHAARLYQIFLGHPKDGWPGDRKLGKEIQDHLPSIARIARNERGFVLRAVETLVGEYGIRQILDVGAGLPHEPNVHQVAQDANPDCRVVYVDNDRTIIANLSAWGDVDERVGYLTADVREPEAILRSRVVQEAIDFSRPVGLVLGLVFHFISDKDDPADIIAHLARELPRGSYVAFSQGTYDHDHARAEQLAALYAQGGVVVNPRDKATIEGFLQGAGLEILPPGVVATSQWRPKPGVKPDAAKDCVVYGALAFKP